MAEQEHMIYKMYTYRLYPNQKQKEFFKKCFNATCFIYNYFLDFHVQKYGSDCSTFYQNEYSKMITQMRRTADYSWLSKADVGCLHQALKNLNRAYSNYRAGRAGRPRHHTNDGHRHTYTTQNTQSGMWLPTIQVSDRAVRLNKIGWVKAKISQPCIGDIKFATVELTPTGKYFVYLSCLQKAPEYVNPTVSSVGLDLGINSFVTFSFGAKLENPDFLDKKLKRLVYEHSKLSRKTKGSSRYEKQRIKVAKLYEDVVNARTDYLHKLSTSIVEHCNIIGVEDLDVKKMVESHDSELSRKIWGASWGQFLSMLKYKSSWQRRWFEEMDKYYPSSQICSNCGFQNEKLRDCSIREWDCPQCGVHHDRDLNAAINIEKEAVRMMKEQYQELMKLQNQ